MNPDEFYGVVRKRQYKNGDASFIWASGPYVSISEAQAEAARLDKLVKPLPLTTDVEEVTHLIVHNVTL
jgi:hypothetical protein